MSQAEGYDPLSVEAVIDDAYREAEELKVFQEEVEDAIATVEKLPYSVHRTGGYTEEEMIESLDGIFKLENLASRVRSHFGIDLDSEERTEAVKKINRIEKMLDREAYTPAREHGEIVYESEIT